MTKRQIGFLSLAIAAAAFEIFNFDTTKIALSDIINSDIPYSAMWVLVISTAFCLIDIAAATFVLSNPPLCSETEFLFNAWFLAISLNAILTWHAVGLHTETFPPYETVESIFPVFMFFAVIFVRLTLVKGFDLLYSDYLSNKRAMMPTTM